MLFICKRNIIFQFPGLTIQANLYYKMLINWTSQKVKASSATRNAFDFKNVCSFDRSLMNAPGPCVLFATPGMIRGGFSLEVFKQWAPHEENLIALPGYCVAGTVGHKLMSAKVPTRITIDQDTEIDVRCQIHQLAFSPHSDAKGIMDLIKFLSPKHVILVHGEKPKMETLKGRIETELGIRSYVPANNEKVSVPSTHYVKADASDAFLQSAWSPNFKFVKTSPRSSSNLYNPDMIAKPLLQVCDDRGSEGILTTKREQNLQILHQSELTGVLEGKTYKVQFALCLSVRVQMDENQPVSISPDNGPQITDKKVWLQQLLVKLSAEYPDLRIQDNDEYLHMESFSVSFCSKEKCPRRIFQDFDKEPKVLYFCCTWEVSDEKLAWKVISTMRNLQLNAV